MDAFLIIAQVICKKKIKTEIHEDDIFSKVIFKSKTLGLCRKSMEK